jgi:hypothetical protein
MEAVLALWEKDRGTTHLRLGQLLTGLRFSQNVRAAGGGTDRLPENLIGLGDVFCMPDEDLIKAAEELRDGRG